MYRPFSQKEFKVIDFQFIEQIGKGKFGFVQKAKEIISRQIVAIKIIPKKLIYDQGMYERLRNEIQVHSRLKYPHICQVYCYFHYANSVYLVMQYCPNGTLYQKIKLERRQLNENQIARLMYQLLFALDYLHKRFVMHRDIKLQNILLDQKLNLKLSDFGCCAQTIKPRITFCGTLEYISPEIVNQQKYTQKVDIYCAGIVLYELFYLVTPFERGNEINTLNNIRTNKVQFNDTIRVVPQSGKDLILQMICKDPTKRPSAEKALEHLFFKQFYSGPNYVQTK